MDFLLSAIPGLAIATGCYFLYLVSTKGLPAALAWVKAKWTAGRAELNRIDDDLTHAYERIAVLERQVVDLMNKVSGRAQATASAAAAPIVPAAAAAAPPAAPAADPAPLFLQPKPATSSAAQ